MAVPWLQLIWLPGADVLTPVQTAAAHCVNCPSASTRTNLSSQYLHDDSEILMFVMREEGVRLQHESLTYNVYSRGICM